MNATLIFTSIATLLLCSCSGGGYIQTAGVKVAPPLSFLGKQSFDGYSAAVKPDGTVTVSITGYKTQNPDPDLTKGVVSYGKSKILGDVTKHVTSESGLTTRHIDDNAVSINAANKAAEVEKLKVLNPPPVVE